MAKSREVVELMRLKASMSDMLEAAENSGRRGYTADERQRWNAMLQRHDELELIVNRQNLKLHQLAGYRSDLCESRGQSRLRKSAHDPG